MLQFTTINEIACPPEKVFAHIIDLKNWKLFSGWGPLSGIVEASLPEGQQMGPGARVRVKNTDGSVHHEVVVAFEPDKKYAVHMELSPPASYLMDRIEEEVTLEDPAAGGSRITRRFTVTSRSWMTAPVVWVIAKVLLRQAVIAHDEAVRNVLERG